MVSPCWLEVVLISAPVAIKMIRPNSPLCSLGRKYPFSTAALQPQPLPPAQEQALLRELAAGSESAKQTLIERNLRLVVYLARRFENTGIGMEDLISIGTIGLIKAVSTFRVDRNIKLATYASRCIENEILMYIRAEGRGLARRTDQHRLGRQRTAAV